jgi:hypothetical protein
MNVNRLASMTLRDRYDGVGRRVLPPVRARRIGRSTNDGVSDPASTPHIEPQREAAGSLTPSFVRKEVDSESVQLLRERCGMAVTSVMPQPSRR